MTVHHLIPWTPAIFEALRDQAVAGNVKAIDLWLTKVENLVDKLKLEFGDETSDGLSLIRDMEEHAKHNESGNQETSGTV